MKLLLLIHFPNNSQFLIKIQPKSKNEPFNAPTSYKIISAKILQLIRAEFLVEKSFTDKINIHIVKNQ